MKPSQTMSSMDGTPEICTSGDLRRLVSNALLALARKEISATDAETMAKGLDAISNSINTEIKVARAQMDMKKAGLDIGKNVELGRLLIG